MSNTREITITVKVRDCYLCKKPINVNRQIALIDPFLVDKDSNWVKDINVSLHLSCWKEKFKEQWNEKDD